MRGAAEVLPYLYRSYDDIGENILEIRPRSGRWYPFHVLVPAAERPLLLKAVTAPHGQLPGPTMTPIAEATLRHGQTEWCGIRIAAAVDNLQAAFLYFSKAPSAIRFGQFPDQMYELKSRAL